MIKKYDDVKRTMDMYLIGEEELRKRAKYTVYILDWNVDDLPNSPTDVVRIFYVEHIDESFLDTAFSYGYFGYPIFICDMNAHDPEGFSMQDILSAHTVKNFLAAKEEYDRQKKQSLEEKLKAEAERNAINEDSNKEKDQKKTQKVALLILS